MVETFLRCVGWSGSTVHFKGAMARIGPNRNGKMRNADRQCRRLNNQKGVEMPMREMRGCARRLVMALACLVACAPALSAPTVNKFEPSASVGGSVLLLNGKGTRYRFVAKVYDMALYTTRRVETSAELLALGGAKRLSFVALRELSGTDLGRLFVRGMSDNASNQQLLPHTLATSRLIEIFSGKSKLMPGETFAMEYVPGKGTTFFIQGVPQGAPVGNDEFFTFVLRIWFGDSPVDWKLRDGLLEGSRD